MCVITTASFPSYVCFGCVSSESVVSTVGPLPLRIFEPIFPPSLEIDERAEIEQMIRLQGEDEELRSPVTNEPMGPRLFPAVQVRNAIEQLVRSGVIAGAKADRWKVRIEEEAVITSTKKRAAGGDTEAMCDLGYWYTTSRKGLEKDFSLGYRWYKEAADNNDVRGMAEAASCLVDGLGTKKNVTEGMTLMGIAAQGGSALGAHYLGTAFLTGDYGLSKNLKMSKYWLHRLVNGSCNVGTKWVGEEDLKEAKDNLQKIEDGDFDEE
mmetsp:Transcript_54076/g.161878  ORF Transcript_54076/g.161878 Transcript_54076/m.161878 type:complete len:266 (-) Transcript_54076:157-954(-)